MDGSDVYDVMVTSGEAPSVQEIAEHFAITPEDGRLALHRLNDAHLLI